MKWEKGILREQVIEGRKEICGKWETQGKYEIRVKQGKINKYWETREQREYKENKECWEKLQEK